MRPRGAGTGIAGYLLLLLPITYTLELLVLWRGGLDGPLFEKVAPLIMFLPGIAALVMLADLVALSVALVVAVPAYLLARHGRRPERAGRSRRPVATRAARPCPGSG